MKHILTIGLIAALMAPVAASAHLSRFHHTHGNRLNAMPVNPVMINPAPRPTSVYETAYCRNLLENSTFARFHIYNLCERRGIE